MKKELKDETAHDLSDAAQNTADESIQKLVSAMRSEKARWGARVSAALRLLDQSHGKPPRGQEVPASPEFVALMRNYADEAVGTVLATMRSTKASPRTRISAAQRLMDHVYGKPAAPRARKSSIRRPPSGN